MALTTGPTDSNPNHQLGPDHFEEILRQRPEIPKEIRHTLGAENVRRIVDILTTGSIIDPDLFVASGDLTTPEAMQYAQLLPEHDEIRLLLNQAFSKLARDLRIKMRGAIENQKLNKPKENITTLYNTADNLFQLLRRSFGGYRWMLIHSCQAAFHSEFFAELDEVAGDKDRQILIDLATKVLNPVWKRTDGVDYPGAQFLSEIDSNREGLKLPAFSDFVPQKTLSTTEKEDLKLRLATNFEQIKDLRQYRNIHFTPFTIGRAKVSIMADDDLANSTVHGGICTLQIVLRPNMPLEQPISVSNENFTGKGYTLRPGNLNLSFNSITGELCFLANNFSSVSKLMTEDQYLQLKDKIYDLVLEYLEGKEPDIEDLFIARSHPLDEGRKETQEQVEQNLGTSPEAAIEITPSFSTDHEKKVYLLNRIRGIRSNRVRSALIRIMGPPERIRGSHQFFRSPYNNKLFPIPIHGSATVKFPLLRACLERWDISLEEFCETV